jgi:gliding motility-associated-like protein
MYANGLWNDLPCDENARTVVEVNLCPEITATPDTSVCSGGNAKVYASAILGSQPYSYSWNPGSLVGPVQLVSPAVSPSEYIVKVTDRYSCFSQDTVNVTINNCTSPPAPKGCDINAINTAFAATGYYTPLNVSGQQCSLYFIDTRDQDAASAEASANALGAHTVVMNDATENANVTAALNAGGYLAGGAKVWIGIKRTGTGQSTFYPLDGSYGAFTPNVVTPGVYQNFNGGEPNNSGYHNYCALGFGTCNTCIGQNKTNCQQGEQCVQIYSSGFWNDESCTGNDAKTVIEVNLCPEVTAPTDITQCTPTPVTLTSTVVLGSQPYTHNWTPGNLPNGSSVTPAVTTMYIDSVADRYKCIGKDTFKVTVASVPAPSITLNPANTVCPNRNVNVTLNNPSSDPAATYTWNFNGATVVSGSGAGPYIISWGTPGSKTVSLAETSNGCNVNGSAGITVNTPPVADAGIDIQACPGVPKNLGSASIAGNTYQWIPTLGLSDSTISNPVFFAPSNPFGVTIDTNYIVVVSSGGCFNTDTVRVKLFPDVKSAFTINPAGPICTGAQETITLSNPISPTASYAWNFDGGTVVSGSGGGPYSISWAAGGTKNITLDVTDNGCFSPQGTGSIVVNQTPTANAGADVQVCPATPASLGAATVAGNTYAWTPVIGLDDPSISNPTFLVPSNPTGATIDTAYTLVVSSNGCFAYDTVRVKLYPDVTTAFTTNPSGGCIGQNISVTYSNTISATANYTWNFDGGTIVSGSGGGPYTISWASPGNKNVTLDVTDNGCPSTQTLVVVQIGTPPAADAGPDQTVCSGGFVQIGALDNPNYTYQWTPGVNLDDSLVSDPFFSFFNTTTSPVNFTLTVVADSNGCKASDDVIVTVSPPLATTLVASGPVSFCKGQNVTFSDNDPFVQYLWSNNDQNPTITVDSAGQYQLVALDANSCLYVSDIQQVTVWDLPTVSLAPNGQIDESCYDYHDGSLTALGAGGAGSGYSYVWSNTPASNTATASPLAPGAYDVTVTDQNGCTATGQYSINAAPYFGASIDSSRDVSCFGRSDGAIYSSPIGGTPPTSYLWSTGSKNKTLKGIVAGNYSVTLTDSKGCVADTTIAITEPVEIIATTTTDLNLKYGEQTEIDVTVNPSGSYLYNWTPASSLSCSVCEDPLASPTRTTTYTLIVEDNASGCLDTTRFVLKVDPSKYIYIPNVFTPNGDGRNDVYRVFTRGPVKYFSMEIFDRWGEKVFDGDDLEKGWDGTFKGTPVQPGVYVYQVNITFLDAEVVKNKGTITVFK